MGTLTGLAPMLLIFVIFYVVLMLPMQRQRKALQQVIANLKKGDRVLTTGGLYGEVTAVEGATVIAAHRRQRPRAGRQVGDLRPRGESSDKSEKAVKGSQS